MTKQPVGEWRANITLPLTRFHPEIANPTDRSPTEMSCEELALAAAPQLLFMNLTVASAMLNAFTPGGRDA